MLANLRREAFQPQLAPELVRGVPRPPPRRVRLEELFMGVWGVGPSTAQKLAARGFRTLADLERPDVHLSTAQRIGLRHHAAFQERIPREEVAAVTSLVRVNARAAAKWLAHCR